VSVVQFHLLLNHFPTIGFAAVCALFAMALLRKNEDLKQASLIGFFLIALITIPVYLSGSAAEFVVRDQPGVSAEVIAAHQDAAMLALLFMQIAGFVAWLALWRFQRWAVPALVVLSIVTFGLMVRAANIGGEIRHPEILAEGVAASASSWPQAAAMGAALVVNHPWVWPICEIFHFVGLCLLFGITTLVNLRMLGVIKGVDVADINRLLPVAVIGLAMKLRICLEDGGDVDWGPDAALSDRVQRGAGIEAGRRRLDCEQDRCCCVDFALDCCHLSRQIPSLHRVRVSRRWTP
jgi:hypothetical protein